MKNLFTFDEFLNESTTELTISLSKSAAISMERDLKANGVKFEKKTPTVFIMDDSPKARTAIRLVRERFGTKSIIVKQ
jgi:hypothetical protein